MLYPLNDLYNTSLMRNSYKILLLQFERDVPAQQNRYKLAFLMISQRNAIFSKVTYFQNYICTAHTDATQSVCIYIEHKIHFSLKFKSLTISAYCDDTCTTVTHHTGTVEIYCLTLHLHSTCR